MTKIAWVGVLAGIAAGAWAARPVTFEELATRCDARAIRFVSPLVTAQTPGQGVDVEADVRDAPYVTLIVTDGGDSYACDHSDWLDARFVGSFGEKRLSQTEWVYEQCGWNSSAKNKSVAGRPFGVQGKAYADGIGTHSPGLLVYRVPDGAEKFRAHAALDDSGVKQGNPAPSSVQFIVYAGVPPLDFLRQLRLEAVPDPAARARFEALVATCGADAAKEFFVLDQAAKETPTTDTEARLALFRQALDLRRTVAFANPLLKPISRILFITREAFPPDEYQWGVHMCDQFFGFHATVHGTTQGNGLYVLENPWSDHPTVRNLLTDSVIEAGARKGQTLGNGGYLAPDVSFDGRQILFCYTDGDANAQYGTIDSAKRRYAIALLDVFGNKIPLYTHPQISCLSPMPLHGRPKPPVLAHATLVGQPRLQNGEKPTPIPPEQLPKFAKVGVVNVYNTRLPFPEDTTIKALRIWQVLPKTTPLADHPHIGYGSQKGAKLVLGTVPVEKDKAPDLRRGDVAKNKETWTTSFASLRPFVKFYDSASWTEPYTVPGRFGAKGSKLFTMLATGHGKVALTDAEMLRLTIWMDSNGLFFGHDRDTLAQAQGQAVPPPLQ